MMMQTYSCPFQNDGQSKAKEQSVESSTEANQNINSVIEENEQFEGGIKILLT